MAAMAAFSEWVAIGIRATWSALLTSSVGQPVALGADQQRRRLQFQLAQRARRHRRRGPRSDRAARRDPAPVRARPRTPRPCSPAPPWARTDPRCPGRAPREPAPKALRRAQHRAHVPGIGDAVQIDAQRPGGRRCPALLVDGQRPGPRAQARGTGQQLGLDLDARPGRCRPRTAARPATQPAASAAASRSSPSATNRPARSRARR